jgi:iron complex outermembrane receptor protein
MLDDKGVGVYGQGTFLVGDRTELTAGVRVDHERRDADLQTEVIPAVFPGTQVTESRNYTAASPQVAAAFELRPGARVYASVGRSFKAGGFNPVSLPGEESYGEEFAWHVEGGVKTSAAGGRLTASAAVFSIDWQDLQLNRPIPGVPGQFFIGNVGGATSRGAEFELTGRVYEGVDLFGAFGFTRARFDAGTMAGGVDIADHKVPFTPTYTATFGAQLSRAIADGRLLWARAEIVCFGAFEYDETNVARQDAYELTNLRAGLRGRTLFVEAWVRNAFNTAYVPVAFAYPGFAPSGFVGEPGRPRTAGISFGARF